MSVVLVDTTDLAEAEAVLSANFSKMSIHAVSADTPTSIRIERSFAGTIGVDTADYECGIDYATEPLGQILLCRVISGGLEERAPGHEAALFEPGDVGAFGAHGQLPITGRVRAGHYEELVIDQGLLSEVAAGPPDTVEPVRLTGSRPVSPAAHRHLSNLIEFVKATAVSHYSDENPLAGAALERYVAEVLVATLPNTALLEPTIEDRHDSTPLLLKRAMAYIDDNAHLDISLTDIAGVVHVTPRALQYMFRKHRDCTPMDYLRRARLHYAHLDLVAGNHAMTTVGAVARRWGFGHMGRFAVYYREQYGQSPHVTLRN